MVNQESLGEGGVPVGKKEPRNDVRLIVTSLSPRLGQIYVPDRESGWVEGRLLRCSAEGDKKFKVLIVKEEEPSSEVSSLRWRQKPYRLQRIITLHFPRITRNLMGSSRRSVPLIWRTSSSAQRLENCHSQKRKQRYLFLSRMSSIVQARMRRTCAHLIT